MGRKKVAESEEILDGYCEYTLETRILVKCEKGANNEYKGKKYCNLHYETVRRQPTS